MKGDHLYLVNYETGRWPAGNPETGYLNTDGSPTKTEILRMRTDPENGRFWNLSFGKRPSEEFYNLTTDPDCLHNLAGDPAQRDVMDALRVQMEAELTAQGDPRMKGEGRIFDQYEVANDKNREFYRRYLSGEIGVPNWVNASDFEDGPLD